MDIEFGMDIGIVYEDYSYILFIFLFVFILFSQSMYAYSLWAYYLRL